MGYLVCVFCLVGFFTTKDSLVLVAAGCFAIAGAIEHRHDKRD